MCRHLAAFKINRCCRRQLRTIAFLLVAFAVLFLFCLTREEKPKGLNFVATLSGDFTLLVHWRYNGKDALPENIAGRNVGTSVLFCWPFLTSAENQVNVREEKEWKWMTSNKIYCNNSVAWAPQIMMF